MRKKQKYPYMVNYGLTALHDNCIIPFDKGL